MRSRSLAAYWSKMHSANTLDEVYKSLIAGKPGGWKAGKNQIEIIRDDWHTGTGYEVKFIIR